MIKFEQQLIKDQKHVHEIICCDCYFDSCFYLLRKKVNLDEFNNRFSNLSNCYYSFVFSTMILCCYEILTFMIINNMNELYGTRNCLQTFIKQNSRLCVLCANDLIFNLVEMNEFILYDYDEE